MLVANTGTLLTIEKQQEAKEIVQFLETLEPQEKQEVLIFIQGIKFARSIKKQVRTENT